MLLSLCLPTNGRVEWVSQVLDSIYEQDVPEELYEIVITDNGKSDELSKVIEHKYSTHTNLRYKRTDADGFMNQLESFKMASGEFVKFINHRCRLVSGTLEYLVEFVKDNLEDKPGIFFSNGTLKFPQKDCASLGEYLVNMGYYCTWSGGLGFWRDDFKNFLNENVESNSLFPHFSILTFGEKQHYIIDNVVMFVEIPFDGIKGYKYNIFYAFGVVYPHLLLELLHKKRIDIDEYLIIKNNNLEKLAYVFFQNIVLKKKCDYDFTNYKQYLRVFYSLRSLYWETFKLIVSKVFNKFKSVFSGGKISD